MISKIKAAFERFLDSAIDCIIPPSMVSYESCHKHRLNYNTKLSDNVLLIVHPFYAKSIVKKEYYNNYERSVYKAIKAKNWTKALFTYPSAYNYEKALLESGRINKVFFTEQRSGVVLDQENLDELQGKRLVLLGTYAELCVAQFLNSLKERGINSVEYLVEGLLFSIARINNVLDNNELLNRMISEDCMPNLKRVHLESIIKS